MKLRFWRDLAQEQLADDKRMVGVMQKRLIELDRQRDNIESEEMFIGRQLPKIKERVALAKPKSSKIAPEVKAADVGLGLGVRKYTGDPAHDAKMRVMQAQTDIANDQLIKNGVSTRAGNASNANSLRNIKATVFPVTGDDPKGVSRLYGPHKLTWNELLRRAMVKMSHDDPLARQDLDEWEQKAWYAFQNVQRATGIHEFDDVQDEPLI
jgi:hypothetical protein